jgi:Mn-dependent DtxR family transcriptional regulator
LAGWTIDQIIGEEVDIDEETARLTIAELYAAGLIRINEDNRLEPTKSGREIWEKHY